MSPQPLPQPLGPAEYAQIEQVLVYLVLFVALAINAAFGVLLGWAILPSLARSSDAPADLLGVRRVLLPMCLVAGVLMLLALVRGLAMVFEVAARIYPRSAI